MIKELVTDEALLSTPCEPATVEDIAVATDLTDTLASLENAGCLAANQMASPARCSPSRTSRARCA